jgi:hypothetical protein
MIPAILAGITTGVKEKYFVAGNYEQAAILFEQLIAKEPMVEFLTNYCYDVME